MHHPMCSLQHVRIGDVAAGPRTKTAWVLGGIAAVAAWVLLRGQEKV